MSNNPLRTLHFLLFSSSVLPSMHWCLLFLLLLLSSIATVHSKRRHSGRWINRNRRTPSAFALAYLQRAHDIEAEDEQVIPKESIRIQDDGRRRDDVVNDAKCLTRCNRELNIGMDMVDAHSSFGSIDVPSVRTHKDLDLFCSLDSVHSKCIDECGYSVQFNLREYICRRRRHEMIQFLPCYTSTAPFLTRYCRPRCGSYRNLEHSEKGYGERCRQLLCDHTCADYLLRRVCGVEEGRKASEFLLHFSRIQVDFWVNDYARTKGESSTRAVLKNGTI